MYTYHPEFKIETPFILYPPFIVGGAFHEIMEQAVFGFTPPTNFPNMKKLFGVDYSRELRKLDKMADEAMKAFRDLGLTPLEAEVKLERNGYTTRIDVIAKDQWNEPVLLDWKTTEWDYTPHALVTSDQLISYADIYAKVHRVIPKIAYVAINKNTFSAQGLMCNVTASMLVNWQNKYQHFKEKVGHGIFDRNPSVCINFKSGEVCPFYERCWEDHWQNRVTSTVKTVQPISLHDNPSKIRIESINQGEF